MKKGMLVFVSLFLTLLSVPAQDTLFVKNVDFPVEPTKGPNSKNFIHYYVEAAFFAGESEFQGADIRYGYSREGRFGYRYKRKLTECLSTGLDVEYVKSIYDLVQNEEKIFPNDLLHEKELLVLNQAGLGLFFRLNFKKRGNFMGNFIDIGGYANWVFSGKHIVWDKVEDPDLLAGESKTIYKELDYLQDVAYGFKGRIGFNRYVLSLNYRWSDIFKEGYDEFPQLPPYSIGLQVGLHK